jgi:hypothetical protein
VSGGVLGFQLSVQQCELRLYEYEHDWQLPALFKKIDTVQTLPTWQKKTLYKRSLVAKAKVIF